MITESHIDGTIDRLFREIQFAGEPAGLYDPLRYMIGIGGKRIRPRLCLTAYSIFKDRITPKLVSSSILSWLVSRLTRSLVLRRRRRVSALSARR